MMTVPPALFTVRTLHSAAAPVEAGAEGDVDEGAVLPVVTVVLAVLVEVLSGARVVDVTSDVDVEEATGREGAAATGTSPTCESASPTICQVRTVASTSAATQAAAMRHVITTRLSQRSA
jgi:hypothetical protein